MNRKWRVVYLAARRTRDGDRGRSLESAERGRGAQQGEGARLQGRSVLAEAAPHRQGDQPAPRPAIARPDPGRASLGDGRSGRHMHRLEGPCVHVNRGPAGTSSRRRPWSRIPLLRCRVRRRRQRGERLAAELPFLTTPSRWPRWSGASDPTVAMEAPLVTPQRAGCRRESTGVSSTTRTTSGSPATATASCRSTRTTAARSCCRSASRRAATTRDRPTPAAARARNGGPGQQQPDAVERASRPNSASIRAPIRSPGRRAASTSPTATETTAWWSSTGTASGSGSGAAWSSTTSARTPNPHDRGSLPRATVATRTAWCSSDDRHLYVCDRGDDRILVYNRRTRRTARHRPSGNGATPVCQPLKIITVIPGTGVTAGRRMAV